ncbi:prepilin-type cleavage/methylation domain-containing protein [Dehalobacter sp. DCM]|nr:prepilin-type cleavage/methylation domain-containing protein [Dehalobacter sp. DCM]
MLLIQIPNHTQEKAIMMTADGLLQDLRETQQAAMAESVWYKVRFYPSMGTYKIYKQGLYVRTVTLQDKVTFGNVPTDIIFNASGAPNVGLTIMLQCGDRAKKVIVAPVMGRIRVD